MWKDFFYFTKKEKQGILILFVLIIGIFIGKILFSRKLIKSPSNREITEIQDSGSGEEKNTGSKNGAIRSVAVSQPVFFDPNSADSATMLQSGLKPYVVRNIIRYREKGGKFRKLSDVEKIYGLDAAQFEAIRPYITIRESSPNHLGATDQSIQALPSPGNTISPPGIRKEPENVKIHTNTMNNKAEKYAIGIKIDINTADSTEFKKIPGIGSAFTARIIKYRKILGGFYSVGQIKEVYGMDENTFQKVSQWMKTEENSPLSLISVNKNSLDRLKSHPYINFYQAKAIIELRNKHGKIEDLSQLALLEEFPEADIERLKYYLTFE